MSYTIPGFDEDFRGRFDFEDEGNAPALRLTESASCIECFPSPCSCGIAQSAVELVDTQAAALHEFAVGRFVASLQLRHAKGDTWKALAAAEAWQYAEMMRVLRRAARQGGTQ